MGFFDKLTQAAKAIEKAVDVVNDVINSDNNSGSNTSGQNNSGVRYGSLTPADVIKAADEPIAPYKLAEDCYYEGDSKEVKVSFEIPEDFMNFDSHAEPEMCYMYKGYEDYDDMDFNKPVVCITCEDFAYTAVEQFVESGKVEDVIFYEPVNVGNFLFKAKCVYYDKQYAYFYGFEKGEDKFKEALAITYCKDLDGSALEKKLMEILDHAAATYTETR